MVLIPRGLAAGTGANPQGDYTSIFNGTSAAAPNASGAVALLLETQPELTWRDVKHVLAKTARQLHADTPRVRVAFGGVPAVLQHGWITNAAGYHFHNLVRLRRRRRGRRGGPCRHPRPGQPGRVHRKRPDAVGHRRQHTGP